MSDSQEPRFVWLDLLWLVFLAGLAVLPPLVEFHKQLILLSIGLFQIFERRIMGRIPVGRRNAYSIIVKVLLSSLLLDHTSAVAAIDSSYYPIYYLPVVSAAMIYGGWGTMFWTAVTSAAYCSFLIPAIRLYRLTPDSISELALRNLFFFLIAIVVNRLVSEFRRQTNRYRLLAEEFSETNRKLELAQEEARRSERLAALGQLSAGLAHEIRNPLGVIKGSAEMLSQKLQSADPIACELAGYISSEVERLNALVGRFLDFARPLQLDLRPSDITSLIEKSLNSMRDLHPASKIEVRKNFEVGLPPVPLDLELSERVFANLFQNAYDAMPDGGQLSVAANRANSDGRQGVEIEIADTGPGIPEGNKEQIFNPFFTTKKTGVGLGLSIVSKIVDNHGGRIRVSSRDGEGACFKLFFPAAP
ncbi:MAG TPA: ATP-binding protein [Terriglobia bacterium]|nr:ATP-binding protein [Terriglobia bacterium]